MVSNQGDSKTVWNAIFKRRGGTGKYTAVFESLEPVQQRLLLSHVELGIEESPVIASVGGKETWFLLTTCRIMWAQDGNVHEVPIGQIHSVGANLAEVQVAGSKASLDSLTLQTAGGSHWVIRLEGGPPLAGIWQVLLNIVDRNRNSPAS